MKRTLIKVSTFVSVLLLGTVPCLNAEDRYIEIPYVELEEDDSGTETEKPKVLKKHGTSGFWSFHIPLVSEDSKAKVTIKNLATGKTQFVATFAAVSVSDGSNSEWKAATNPINLKEGRWSIMIEDGAEERKAELILVKAEEE